MKVKELIEALEKFDQEIDVVVDDIEHGFINVEMITDGGTKEGKEVVIIN